MNKSKFPEIVKAVGAQRGGKYLKRVPKPGGGYRYVYKETGDAEGRLKVQERISSYFERILKMDPKKREEWFGKMSPQRRSDIKFKLKQYERGKTPQGNR